MTRAVAINGSPQMEKGNTALVLGSFIQGMMEAGSEVELLYASQMKVKPCSCGVMYCWNDSRGECCIQDNMQSLYQKLKAAEILILATPVYVPLPGDMQNVVNRLMPLIDPKLERRQGRTRALLHKDVNIQKIVLVATSGWWEIENCDTVVRVVRELAKDASTEFAGAVLRPHADAMRADGKVSQNGQAVLDAVRRAGNELVGQGRMSQETLAAVSRPLMPQEP
ncbi:MAG: flavodoxin family protein [Caldiserica bacterium]|nr:flavodoxin family protein [Caldisericota bacterium]